MNPLFYVVVNVVVVAKAKWAKKNIEIFSPIPHSTKG